MTIPIEKLRAVKTIITHDNCSDGTASAILLKDAYAQAGLEVEIKFIQYGTEAYKSLTPTPNMMFCDFTPNVPEIPVEPRQLDEKGEPIKVLDQEKLKPWLESDCIILDHHKGAKKLVAALGPERCEFADEIEQPGVAGAMLAFRHVWLPFHNMTTRGHAQRRMQGSVDVHLMSNKTAEELVHQLEADLKGTPDLHDEIVSAAQHEVNAAHDLATIVAVRDTWQRTHWRWQNSCEWNEVLRFFPNEDWLDMPQPFRQVNKAWWDERSKLGVMLWAKHVKSVQKAIEKSWRFTSEKGTRVLVFEGVRLSSDVAEALDKEVDLIMAFDYEAEVPKTGGTPIRKIIYSTRSHAGFDCQHMAKGFGGGGHTPAAGFNVEFGVGAKNEELSAYGLLRDPYSLAEVLVGLHERKQQQT